MRSDAAVREGFVARQIEPAMASFLGSQAPQRVGPYRIVGELGKGGMGTVYLAERDDEEYHTKVAIKLVRRGMDTDLILHRFYRERQTLARLQHPNIARLLDGGTTEHGDPYIVMEYVEGERITEYCERRQLGTRERLELFLEVCKAVDYAHRNFVVHRDLKPGNILVDKSGTVKLLDFGICKLLHTEEAPGAMTKEMSPPPLTPDYASPEQILAEPITVASDVYSAAAVLYELLTGKTPHRIEDYSLRGIERGICETEIVRPGQLSAQLAGDLDNILMHALEKDPGRRYASIDQFAEDIRRHLSHEPVRARANTVTYRVGKFVRRRSGLVAAAAAVLVTMAGGAAMSWRSARIANENLGLVRKLSNTFVFDVYDAVHDLPGSTRARELIVKTGLEYLDNLSRNASGNIELQKELAAAYFRIGDVQGGVMRSNLGDTRAALASYQKAKRLWDAVLARNESDLRAGIERVRLHRKIGSVREYTKAGAEAIASYREAQRLADDLARRFPDEDRIPVILTSTQIAEAMVVRRDGDYKRAHDLYQSAVKTLEPLAAKYPEDPEILGNLATALSGIAMSYARIGRLPEGLAAHRRSLASREKLAASEPSSATHQRNLMFSYSYIGDILGNPNLPNLGDRKGAVDAYRKMEEVARRLHEADPADQRARSDYAIALTRVSAVLPEADTAERIRVLRKSIQLQEEVARVNPDNALNRSDIVYNYNFLGDALDDSGNKTAAIAAYTKGISIVEPMLGEAAGSLVSATAFLYRKLGVLHGQRGERRRALECAKRSFEIASPDGDFGKKRTADVQNFLTPRAYSALGLTYAALAQSASGGVPDSVEARRWLTKSLALYRELAKLPSYSNTHRREVNIIEKALEKVR